MNVHEVWCVMLCVDVLCVHVASLKFTWTLHEMMLWCIECRLFVMCRVALAWSFGHDSRRLEVKAHESSWWWLEENKVCLHMIKGLAMKSSERMEKYEESKDVRVRIMEICQLTLVKWLTKESTFYQKSIIGQTLIL